MFKTFTKKFIREQKNYLEKELEKIKKQIEELKRNDPFADPDHASDNAAVDTDVREQVGHETIEAQIKDLEKRKADISFALNKIANNTYGLCNHCRQLILVQRLKLIPEARYCIDCEKKLRK